MLDNPALDLPALQCKASGKLVRDEDSISQYWRHTTQYGWHKRDHPGFAVKAAPMGLYGDDCRYNKSGEKLVILNCNTILQEPKRTLIRFLYVFFLTAYLGLRKSTEDCPNKMIIFSAKSNSGGLDLCRFPVFALRVSRLVPDYSLTRVYALLVWSFKAVQQFKVSTYGVFTKDGVTTVCN